MAAFDNLSVQLSAALAAADPNNAIIPRLPSQSASQPLHTVTLGQLVLRYQHKMLVLFKLLLLEKKCLFQLKPVSNLTDTIMALGESFFLPSKALLLLSLVFTCFICEFLNCVRQNSVSCA